MSMVNIRIFVGKIMKIQQRLSITTILGLLMFVDPANAQSKADDLFRSALQKTAQENFTGAIADLQTSAKLFTQEKQPRSAYKSRALSTYLQAELQWQKRQDTSQPLPNWYLGGKCIGEPTCAYGVNYVTPNSKNTSFGGIIILDKHIRYAPNGSPINAVLDVQILPKLKSGEFISTQCQLNGKPDEYLLAIVQPKGFENADFYTKISSAWKINLQNKQIKPIFPKGVACINNCPGGC
jgi:hypothetical protein